MMTAKNCSMWLWNCRYEVSRMYNVHMTFQQRQCRVYYIWDCKFEISIKLSDFTYSLCFSSVSLFQMFAMQNINVQDNRLSGSVSRTMAAMSLGFIVVVTPWSIQEVVAACTGSKVIFADLLSLFLILLKLKVMSVHFAPMYTLIKMLASTLARTHISRFRTPLDDS